MLIEAHEATITMATVEIKTLTVSGRQVTLAVFRQLMNESIEDDAGKLRGTPWGTVNYHPDGCGKHKPHVHVVWELGGELRRAAAKPPESPVDAIRPDRYGPDRVWVRYVESGTAWLDAALGAGWRPPADSLVREEIGYNNFGPIVQWNVLVGFGADYPVAIAVSEDARRLWAADFASDAIAKFKVTRAGGQQMDEATAAVLAELAAQDARYAAQQANWALFHDIPHLFIAV